MYTETAYFTLPFAVNGGNACIDASANPYVSQNILVLGLTHRLENKLQKKLFQDDGTKNDGGNACVDASTKPRYPPTLYRLVYLKFHF
jgi:hypothetical protein